MNERDGRTDEGLLLRVAGAEHVAADIRMLRLRRADGGGLPPFVPGSHVVVDCGDRRNAYSLTGDGIEPEEYTISVLRCPGGDGGSVFLHGIEVGDVLRVSGPRSAFPPAASAHHHLLVAGGIGITPMLSHVRAARQWGRSFRLYYAHRPGAGAHVAELRRLCGDRLREYTGRADLTRAVRAELRASPLGTHLYACGPGEMLDDVRAGAAEAGWLADRVHVERFSAAELDPGAPFTVTLARSGTRVSVPSGVSLLEALEKAGTPVPNMCRQGVCGECRVSVVRGRPLHRDLYLSEAERAAADTVMCCVSRCLDQELELDL